jgi:SAM-dependent methyltransferase
VEDVALTSAEPAGASQARTVCLSCGADGLVPVVSLGRLPLANACPSSDAGLDEPRFPLDLAFCPACSLVQLQHVVPPPQLFTGYLYFSSYSQSMLRHVEALADSLVVSRHLGPESLVTEVASNDGYLLQFFKKAGIPVLGIEPADTVADVAVRERGIPTEVAYFGSELAARLAGEGRRSDVILGLNVMAHVPDLNGFMDGMRTMLKPGGVAVIEAPYVRDMVEHTEFDTIYHEHLCYFSVHAVAALVRRHGLVLQHVERVPIHGGSLRLVIGSGTDHGASARRLLDEERRLGLDRASYYSEFGRSIERVRASLVETLADLRARGATVAGYGAAAKGAILLNYCGLDQRSIEFVADRNPYKQGRRMPGCGIPVLGPEAITERHPDYLLVLVWNLRNEIVKQEAAFHRGGGRFIVPIPAVEIL